MSFGARLQAHQVGAQATIIAFTAMYAMFPLVLSLTAVGGFLMHGASVQGQLLGAIEAAFPKELAGDVAGVVTAASQRAGLFGVVGFVALLWSGSNLFASIEAAFNRIYGVSPRGFVYRRMVAFLVILAFAVVLMLSAVVSNMAGMAARWPADLRSVDQSPLVALALDACAVAIVWTLVLLLLYWVIPGVRSPFRTVWPGALIAGTSIELTTWIFPLYLQHGGGVNRFGDVFGITFLLMTWFYVLAYILMIGAEVNAGRYAALAASRPNPPREGASRDDGSR